MIFSRWVHEPEQVFQVLPIAFFVKLVKRVSPSPTHDDWIIFFKIHHSLNGLILKYIHIDDSSHSGSNSSRSNNCINSNSNSSSNVIYPYYGTLTYLLVTCVSSVYNFLMFCSWVNMPNHLLQYHMPLLSALISDNIRINPLVSYNHSKSIYNLQRNIYVIYSIYK